MLTRSSNDVINHGISPPYRFGGTVRHYRLYFEGNNHYVGKFAVHLITINDRI